MIHLEHRDRVALALRLFSVATGFVLVIAAFATSSWDRTWVVGLFVLVVVGGGLLYHFLTSVVRCPTCHRAMTNFRIAGEEAKTKTFLCRHCGASAYLVEGFYWQQDIGG